MKKITWKTEQRKLTELTLAKYNPRKWTPEATEQLKKSIDKFSLADPLIINKNSTVIGGHFRLKILKEQGEKIVDVRVPNRLLTEAEAQLLPQKKLTVNVEVWKFRKHTAKLYVKGGKLLQEKSELNYEKGNYKKIQ